MEKIASFEVNHDIVTKGMYISRVDGDAVTYDIRMKVPNGGDYFSTAAGHTFEHLFATFARNSKHKDGVIYVGPMGCRTGFYLIVRDNISHKSALELVKDAFAFIAAFEGTIPGSEKEECGNFLDHSLEGAKELAADMIPVLENWSESKMVYGGNL